MGGEEKELEKTGGRGREGKIGERIEGRGLLETKVEAEYEKVELEDLWHGKWIMFRILKEEVEMMRKRGVSLKPYWGEKELRIKRLKREARTKT